MKIFCDDCTQVHFKLFVHMSALVMLTSCEVWNTHIVVFDDSVLLGCTAMSLVCRLGTANPATQRPNTRSSRNWHLVLTGICAVSLTFTINYQWFSSNQLQTFISHFHLRYKFIYSEFGIIFLANTGRILSVAITSINFGEKWFSSAQRPLRGVNLDTLDSSDLNCARGGSTVCFTRL